MDLYRRATRPVHKGRWVLSERLTTSPCRASGDPRENELCAHFKYVHDGLKPGQTAKLPSERWLTREQLGSDEWNLFGIGEDLREDALRIFDDASKGKAGQVVRLPVLHQLERTEQMAAGPIEQKLQHQ